MNICIFSIHFGGGYGTGYSIKKEAAEFKKAGYDIFVIHNEEDISSHCMKGIRYLYFKISRIPLLNILLLRKKLISLIKQALQNKKIDIFYIQSPEFGVCIKYAAKIAPIVYFARSTIKGIEKNKPREYWIDGLRRKLIVPILIALENRCLKISDAIVVKSSLLKDELKRLYGISDKKIKIVPGGIDRNDFPVIDEVEKNHIREALKWPTDKKILLYSGRIVPVKGLYYLIKALNKVAAQGEEIILVIAGKSMRSRYFKVIEKIIRSPNLWQHIIFPGYVPQNLMHEYFGACDIVILPSTYEPFGMTAIQAVMMNKPLIVTNRVGAVEIIKTYPLLKIVPAYNYENLADAIMALSTLDIGAHTRQFDLSGLYWKNMAAKILGLFADLIGDNTMITKINKKDIWDYQKA